MLLQLTLVILGANPAPSPESPESAYERGDFKACAALFEKALATRRFPAIGDAYNAACCHAKAGDAPKAFKLLRQAVALGLKDATVLEVDQDLASLRQDEAWAPLVASVKKARADWQARVNPELLRLFMEDQADRQGAMPPDVQARDAARRQAVEAVLGSKVKLGADDYYHAAMVFQHGAEDADIARAHQLAKKAVALSKSHARARWLVAASEDRLLVRQKKKQKWGTQYSKQAGTWVLDEVDSTVTDAQRAEWNVPPLEEARRRLADLNAPPPTK